MTNPRVVFVTTDYSVAGGIERSLSILTKTLINELDIEVTLISCGRTQEKPFFTFSDKLKIIELKTGKSLLKLSSLADKVQHVFSPRSRYSKILDALTHLSFDFLIVDHPILLSALPEKSDRPWKLLLHAHEALRPKKSLKNYLYYRGAHKVDQIVSLTEEDRVKWIDFGIGQVEKIHHYIEEKPVHTNGFKENSIVCVARFVQDKGIDRVIKAFSILSQKHPDTRLNIYGDGPERENYIKLCAELNISEKVTFAGFTNNPIQEISQSKVMALGSRVESFGYVILESFVAGTPVVAFEGPPGPKELIDDPTKGCLVKENDLAAFAKGLEYFLYKDTKINVVSSKETYVSSWKKVLKT